MTELDDAIKRGCQLWYRAKDTEHWIANSTYWYNAWGEMARQRNHAISMGDFWEKQSTDSDILLKEALEALWMGQSSTGHMHGCINKGEVGIKCSPFCIQMRLTANKICKEVLG